MLACRVLATCCAGGTKSSSGPYVPYEISVRAANSAGVGEAREIVIFTKEGGMPFSKVMLYRKTCFVYIHFLWLHQPYSLFKELTQPLH